MTSYCPPDCISVAAAIPGIAKAWYPNGASYSEQDDALYEECKLSELQEQAYLQRRTEAAKLKTYRRIRTLLAEGKLPSFVIASSTGRRWPLPMSFWASNATDKLASIATASRIAVDGEWSKVDGVPLVVRADLVAVGNGGRIASPRENLSDDQKVGDRPSTSALPKNVGGAPAKFTDDMWAEVLAYLDREGLPDRYAPLVDYILQWASDRGIEIGESTIRPRVKMAMDRLRKDQGLPPLSKTGS